MDLQAEKILDALAADPDWVVLMAAQDFRMSIDGKPQQDYLSGQLLWARRHTAHNLVELKYAVRVVEI